MRGWALALLPLTIVGASGHAQSSPGTARPGAVVGTLDSARRLLPGDSTLRTGVFATRTVQYTLTAYREMDEIPVGRLMDLTRVDTVNGAPVLVRVQQLQRGTTRLVDSTRTDLRTLAPLQHRAIQPTRRIALDFAGPRVRGSLTPQDLPPVPIDTVLALPAFDSGNWDLLLRALPLDSGYAVRFPVFDVDAGLHQYHIAVTGRATLLGEPAWVITFTLARGRESTVWVGMQSRTLLQVQTMLNATTMLEQRLLVSPAQSPRSRSPAGAPSAPR